MPGSPVKINSELGIMPPPTTRSHSEMPENIRVFFCVGISARLVMVTRDAVILAPRWQRRCSGCFIERVPCFAFRATAHPFECLVIAFGTGEECFLFTHESGIRGVYQYYNNFYSVLGMLRACRS